MAATKKTKSTARFGSRCGQKLRVNLLAIETVTKASHICPECRAKKVWKVAAGIWKCERCGNKFAGGAYNPFPVKTESK